jgi:two-component system response regulator
VKHDLDVPAARVLVIEDNRSDVVLLELALKKQDLLVDLIHLLDGGEALTFIRRQGTYHEAAIPDLVLLDLNLPKYTGEEILREIRATRHLANVPVCVWSSSRSRLDQARLLCLGAVRFITKPIGLVQFMEIGMVIKNMLAGPRVGCNAMEQAAGSLQDRGGTTLQSDALEVPSSTRNDGIESVKWLSRALARSKRGNAAPEWCNPRKLIHSAGSGRLLATPQAVHGHSPRAAATCSNVSPVATSTGSSSASLPTRARITSQ